MKNKGDIQGRRCESSETNLSLCFFREAHQSQHHFEDWNRRGIADKPWWRALTFEESEEVSLRLYFPTPLQFSKFTLCLCGHVWQDWQSLDAAKHSHNPALMSKQTWAGDLTYFLPPFLKATLLFHAHPLPSFLIWDSFINKMTLTLDYLLPYSSNLDLIIERERHKNQLIWPVNINISC